MNSQSIFQKTKSIYEDKTPEEIAEIISDKMITIIKKQLKDE